MDWILPALTLLAVAASATLVVVRGQRQGRVDPFHPLLFPAIYVAAATLLPVLWLTTIGDPLGYVNLDAFAPQTPLHLSLATAGFVLAAAAPFRSRREAAAPAPPEAGRIVWWCGVALFAIPLCAAAVDVAQSAVLTRGQGQGAGYSITDSIKAAALILAPTGAVLIGVGRSIQARKLGLIDWALFGSLVVLLGLNGRRGAALGVIIVGLMFLVTQHRLRAKGLLAALAGIVLFAYSVVAYRSFIADIGGERTNPIVVVLRDVGSVAFTTGWTGKLGAGTENGATLLAALAYMIPRPIAVHILPSSLETGESRFRDLMKIPDDYGYGYSLAAEGVLNFGALGAFLIPAAFGLAFAWAYSRWNPASLKGTAWIYAVLVATLPFAWRSDALGAVKGNAYPLVAFVVIALATHAVLTRRQQNARPRQDATTD